MAYSATCVLTSADFTLVVAKLVSAAACDTSETWRARARCDGAGGFNRLLDTYFTGAARSLSVHCGARAQHLRSLCVCVCCSTKTLGDGDTTAEPLSAAMASGKTLRNHLINRPIFPRARQVPHVPPVLQCCEAIFGLALPPEAHVLPTASSSAHSGKNSRTLVGAMQRSLAVLSRNDDMHEPIRCDKVTPTLVGSSDDCCAKSIVDAEPRRMVFNYGPRPWGLPSHISRLQ